MYAIYNKSNNKVISRFEGNESQIGIVYDLSNFGYVSTNDKELFGDVNEFIVYNGKVKRRDIDEIIVEIEEKNPFNKQVMVLKNENAELWYQNMMFEGKLDKETADLWYALMVGGDA